MRRRLPLAGRIRSYLPRLRRIQQQSLRSACHDWIPENADVFNLDFDNVSRLESSRRARCTGVDDIPWNEGNVAAEKADNRWTVEDEV